jgi:hypothetical protein
MISKSKPARAAGMITAIVALITGCSRPASSAQSELSAAPETEPSTETRSGQNRGDHSPSLEQTIALKAKKYAQGLVAEGSTMHGALPQGGRSDQLIVLRGGYCYRVLGAGGDGVEDLDLFLYDPNGVQTEQDPGQDRFPVLGLQSEICPATSGAYRLQTLMYKGSGPYALRVYRTP